MQNHLGLINAPAVFQSLVNDVLHDMLNKFVFVYLDDILFFPSVIWSLIKVKKDKCSLDFCKRGKNVIQSSTVSFLRYAIAEGEINMDPKSLGSDWMAHSYIP